MKRSELFFSFLLVPLDYVMIVLAGVSAYYLRFADFTTAIRPVIFDLSFDLYLSALLVVALLWLLIFAFSGLYNIRSARTLAKEVYRVFLACSAGLMLVVILIFFRRELFDSRFIVLAAWAISIFYISFGRTLIRFIQRRLFALGIGVHKVVIIGDSKTADNLVRQFSMSKYSGYEILKRLRNMNSESVQQLLELVTEKDVDEIIQCDPNITKAETLRIYDIADEYHISFRYAADLLGTKVLRTEVSEIAGIPIVEVKRTTLDGWGRIVKRLSDIIFSGLLITILSPILLLVTILIKLDSRGPVFFSRRDDGSYLTRIGQGGKPFRYFKFRSMRPNVDSMRYNELADRNVRKDGPMVKIKDDPRVTRFGRFIRRWSLDELPELFLVFVGRMSLVGPRPHLPEEVAKYEHHHKKTLTVKPGITGLAQISGRSDLAFEEEVKLDTYYIENWSFFLDITILLRTPHAVLRGRGAE